MNPRSTYQEGKKTSKSNLTSSVDRATFQGSSLTASHPKTPNLSAQSEKMSRYISMVLQKVSNEPQRYSGVVPVLKSTNRSLISVISALMRSVDGHFDSSDLEADMIVELFRMIGYTNNISKTIFQPIGAPHTWPSCLQMVEWLAQLSEFHLRLSEVLEERHC